MLTIRKYQKNRIFKYDVNIYFGDIMIKNKEENIPLYFL